MLTTDELSLVGLLYYVNMYAYIVCLYICVSRGLVILSKMGHIIHNLVRGNSHLVVEIPTLYVILIRDIVIKITTDVEFSVSVTNDAILKAQLIIVSRTSTKQQQSQGI